MYNPMKMYDSVVNYVAEHGKSIKRNTLIGITLMATALYGMGCQEVQSTRGKDGKITPQAQRLLEAQGEDLQRLVENGALPKDTTQGVHIGGILF